MILEFMRLDLWITTGMRLYVRWGLPWPVFSDRKIPVPILMTTFSTVVGLSPLALELAGGLERLSPLAIVAGFGMLVGTFLTMVVVPVIYTLLDDARELIF